jgi:hypothetical protein
VAAHEEALRRANDFYPTPSWAERELDRRVPIVGAVAEPCVGAGDLIRHRTDVAWTNDIDDAKPATHHMDARSPNAWALFPPCDWVITNPPFNHALAILDSALDRARVGVAFLLRLSFLEPTTGTARHAGRADWLAAHPPCRLIVLPRISFTGDGNTDSVTCAWMVWSRGGWLRPGVECVSPRAAVLRESQGAMFADAAVAP